MKRDCATGSRWWGRGKKKAGAMPSPALQSVAFELASITGTGNFDSTLLYADTESPFRRMCRMRQM
ncbi:MAG: hypothetical protein K2L73_01925 [Muribaculaceae bacterium]|nr:hypothetical protein [Muribaculaceae bacterium]